MCINAKAAELRRSENKMKELEKLGEPQVHLWGSLVTHINEHGLVPESDKEHSREHLADTSPKDLEEKVLVAPCKKCYDPHKMHFVMCVCCN